MLELFTRVRLIACLIALATASIAAVADDRSKVVDGVTIDIGVIPAALLRGHPKEHPEGEMHGGVLRAQGQYHVMVALFDAKTGERINDAQVQAVVAGVGRPLEPMAIANTITYGNYFYMTGEGPWRIDVVIRRANGVRTIGARFDHRH